MLKYLTKLLIIFGPLALLSVTMIYLLFAWVLEPTFGLMVTPMQALALWLARGVILTGVAQDPVNAKSIEKLGEFQASVVSIVARQLAIITVFYVYSWVIYYVA
jgi:uncharacterized membrane protein